MAEVLSVFLDVLGTAQRDGWGVILVLWIFVLVVLAAAFLAIRAYRSANDNRLAELGERLDSCEEKHKEQSEAMERQREAMERERERRARLQRKLSMVTGLLIAQLGNRALPEGFLQIILNDDIEEVPQLGQGVA
jgi:hypothetical protein